MISALYNMINRFNEALKLDPKEYGQRGALFSIDVFIQDEAPGPV